MYKSLYLWSRYKDHKSALSIKNSKMGCDTRPSCQTVLAFISLGTFLCYLLLIIGTLDGADGQSGGQFQGDRTFQRVQSSEFDLDERDDKLYRRPPTYLIIASKIVRPSTVYKVLLLT